MKKNGYYFLIALLSLSAFVSCKQKVERTVNLDLLICEQLKDNRLTEEQVELLIPFEKDGIRYLVQGSVLNGRETISYTKEKSRLRKADNEQKSLSSKQKYVSNYLKGLDLSSLSLKQPLSADDISRIIKNYEFVLGVAKVSSAYPFKIFTSNTSSEEILAYITDEILVKNPEAKILLVYNPPINNNRVLPASPKSTVHNPDKKEDKPATPKSSPKVLEGKEQGENKKETTTEPPKASLPESPKESPTPEHLNDLLNRITKSDDKAVDEIRKILGNTMRVDGAANISNVQQLITDASNGTHYKVTKLSWDVDDNLISITVSK